MFCHQWGTLENQNAHKTVLYLQIKHEQVKPVRQYAQPQLCYVTQHLVKIKTPIISMYPIIPLIHLKRKG